MARPKSPSFGELDWEIDTDPSGARGGAAAPAEPFDEIPIDLDTNPNLALDRTAGAAPPPASTEKGESRESAPPSRARPARPRIPREDPLSERAIQTVRSAGIDPHEPPSGSPSSDGATRAGRLDPSLLALARGEGEGNDGKSDHPPRRGSTFPSTSGVTSRLATDAQGRAGAIAALRDLYARGEAAEALVVASSLREQLGAPETPRQNLPADALDRTVGATERASSLPAMISSQGVPRLLLPAQEVAQLALDHRAGFLLAHVDGIHSMEEILDVCAMPEAEALAILERLCALGVIAL